MTTEAKLTERAALSELTALLPDGAVITDPTAMEEFRRDRAGDPGAGVPLAVVRASSTAEVQAVVRFAAATGTPLVPRGAGSGVSGGSSAIEGGIVLVLDAMREIRIDTATRTAIVQPGAFTSEVKAAAAAHGLWYPPDPASVEFCSIGGNIATNAGGLCCVKYGVTSDYVLGMQVVLADGEVVTLGGPRIKDSAGLSLTKLFVGSEGTLGVITEAELRLIPPQRPATTLVAAFPSVASAMEAVLGITRGMRPSMLEFMDRASINAVEDQLRMGLDRSAEAMLIVQSDEAVNQAVQDIATVAEICLASGATMCETPEDPAVCAAYVTARREAIPAVEMKGALLLGDVGVPLPRLGELVTGIADIAAEADVTIAVIAHAGDGNTHPLVVLDPSDAEQRERAEAAYGRVMDLATALGGTITGEHGVGKLKRPWLADCIGDDVVELNRRIKRALDPQGILNPGSILEPENDSKGLSAWAHTSRRR